MCYLIFKNILEKQQVALFLFLHDHYDVFTPIFEKKCGKNGGYLIVITARGHSYCFENRGRVFFRDGVAVKQDIGEPIFMGFAINVIREVRRLPGLKEHKR